MTDRRRYSTAGPECPYCEHQETPDEPFYYDDSTDRLECGDCGRPYAVEVYRATSWTTKPLDAEAKPAP